MSYHRIALLTAGLALTLILACDCGWGAPNNPLAASGDSFAGSYAGDQLSVTFTVSDDGNYTGYIKRRDKTFPIQARQNGAEMKGKFSAGADQFEFTATLSGEALSFNTGTSHYSLKRIGITANPLGAARQSNPLGGDVPVSPAGNPPAGKPATGPSDAAPLPDVPLPKGFSELGSTPSGRSIFSNFANIRSIDDLIQHVGDGIGAMFGDKPQFGSACVDAKNKNGGIANFSATLKGAPIKGLMIFGVNPQGASSATVIYTRPNAPSDELTTLMQTVPAQPKMHTTQMPDGSGSIDIPEGWTCKTHSMTAGPIWVDGPKGQSMIVGGRMAMDTPQSFRVQTAKRNYNSAVNLYRVTQGRGIPPKPLETYLANLDISPCVGPEEAFTKIIPKIEDKLRENGKPWQEFGEITFKTSVPPMISADEAEVIGSTMAWHSSPWF